MNRLLTLALSTAAFLLNVSQAAHAAGASRSEEHQPALAGSAIPVPVFYDYPISTFDKVFTRYNSYHDYYGVSIKQNVPDTNHYGIQTWNSGYGDETNTYLDLETGEIFYTSTVYGGTPHSRILPPTQGGDAAAYLESLRSIKGGIEFVATTGHGTGNEPAMPQLNEAIAYLNAILLQLDPPAADLLNANQGELDVGQGESGLLSVAYRSAQERDLLAALFVNSVLQSEQRIALPAGEGTVAVPYLLPASTPLTASAYVSLKLVPRGEPASRVTAEISTPIKVLAAYRISDLVLTYGRLLPGEAFQVETWFTAPMPCDIRVDLFDATGTWMAGKQISRNTEMGGYDSITLDAPATVVSGKSYQISVKLLPSGADWSAYLAQREITVKGGQP